VAQWNGGSAGHVAYVEAVGAGFIEVTDDNYGLNVTDRWRISTSSPAWPDNFIHLRDQAPSPQLTHRAPSVASNLDGRLEVFAIAADGQLYHAFQTAPNGGWSGIGSLGGVLHWNGAPAIGRNKDGRLEAFAIANDGSLQHAYQNSNGTWSAFGALSSSGVFPDGSIASVASNLDGRLEVFAIAADGQLYHAFQTAPNGGWSGIGSLGGAL
jgi:hypothetical protein